MTIDPTREEWLEARERLRENARGIPFFVFPREFDRLTEAALGPCPPEPAPEPFRKGGRALVWISRSHQVHTYGGNALLPDEAEAMAAALVEHARYAREQGPPKEPICGRLPWAHCHLPKGHDGVCTAEGTASA